MLALLCAGFALLLWRDLLQARADRPLGRALLAHAGSPRVSVLIPARNEADRIGVCLEGLALQPGALLEVIVVDDQSTDGTAQLVQRYAGRVPGLRLIRGLPLPAGWAGKCWSCWQAAAEARGEWLLFLDADVIPEPGLVAALVASAERRGADLLSALPRIEMRTAAERLVLPAFFSLVTAIYPFHLVGRRDSPLAFAIGQCLLIRRPCYDALGGHAAVQGSLLEDMQLAGLAKRAGYGLAAVFAPQFIRVRMYSGWASLVEGLTKNAGAGLRNGGPRAAVIALRQAVLAWAPLDALLAGFALGQPGAALVVAGSLMLAFSMLVWGRTLSRRLGIAPWWALTLPLGTLLYFLIAARAWLHLRTGRGLTWKGRDVGASRG
jgi:GT2 family glycosyltransferase